MLIFNVFRPSYDIYGNLSIIFGFSDPENPHFDTLYVNAQNVSKNPKFSHFLNIFTIFFMF